MVQIWKTNFWNYDAKLENYFWNDGTQLENYFWNNGANVENQKETAKLVNYFENQNQKCK